ncbi:hypothetical protein ACFL03_06545 [Thermodesulfobacteriota bacterium]
MESKSDSIEEEFNELNFQKVLIKKVFSTKHDSQQVLMKGVKKCIDRALLFEVCSRRHSNWETITICGSLDFNDVKNKEHMIPIIIFLSKHLIQFYRGIQEILYRQNVVSSFHEDGFLNLGNGRWLHAGAGLAMYHTNEYLFDFDNDPGEGNRQKANALIMDEVKMCFKSLFAACCVYEKLIRGELTFNPLESNNLSSMNLDEIDPEVHHFMDKKATGDVVYHLQQAHRHMQLGDAALLRGGATFH